MSRQRLKKRENAVLNGQLARLIACVIILGVVFALKQIFPEQVNKAIKNNISEGIDVEKALTAVGGGLRNVFSPVSPEPSEEPPEESPLPSASPSPSPLPSPEPEPEPSPSPSQTSAQTSIAEGPIQMDELFLVVEDPEEEDDTLPVPFGMTAPEKADFSIHELPFEYAAPLKGEFSSTFGYRVHPIDNVVKFHYGADIPRSKGTNVGSFADGVIKATGDSSSYGLYVMVEHAGGYVTLYGHLSKVYGRKGDKVKMGTRIGKVGMTGKATGPHLHFEIRYGGKLINPEPYLAA